MMITTSWESLTEDYYIVGYCIFNHEKYPCFIYSDISCEMTSQFNG